MGDSKRDSYDWIKLALDNKALILWIVGFLISAGTNVSQAFDVQKKNEELKTVGESYAAIVYQNMKPETKEKPRKVYINQCPDCNKTMSDHIKEFH